MLDMKNKEECCGCHACSNVCPKQCIKMKYDDEGFLYPSINHDLCINCNLCEKSCPMFKNKCNLHDIISHVGYSLDNSIRKMSSSGGIFGVIAENILSKNGVVFGAAFDEEYNVRHIFIENVNQLRRLQGAKYVQSVIGETYSQAKDFLENGRLVYFTGTPCQIEGLLSYLNQDYDNLITQDIVCHGVPSKEIWQKYLKIKTNGDIKYVSFRDKKTGWINYSITIMSKKLFSVKHNESTYMRAFIKGYSLRPSCYTCKFKKKNRISDITLGDLWGARFIVPDLDDDKGLSLVSINSDKGEILFEQIKDSIFSKIINLEEAILYNPSYIKQTPKPHERDEFIKIVMPNSFDKLIDNKYCKLSIKSKLKKLIRW